MDVVQSQQEGGGYDDKHEHDSSHALRWHLLLSIERM